ncbi:MAG: bifunctional UDP-N-acetylglucosamine diphosphorylase/glucosamine-1-phosphate N-acetyltransferase GlmU [Gammaproteobacteria bacterium]|nr:bifunctional UDP-N-acetylglucosamine diphosphorylase/glucosamine-1-phosphate N-acetyltransferase GlmU [Gammaproteobacteria bacterium]
MSRTDLSVVILAAGAGKRMRSARPKVLQPLAGHPLLAHVLDCTRRLHPAAVHVVYGHGGEEVRARFAEDAGLNWVLQSQQLGTGHAVLQAMPQIPDSHVVLVLCGDVPLLRPETLAPLLAAAADGVAVLTVELADATGYGRIVRDAAGAVHQIVEERDANDAVRALNEVNTGVIAAPAGKLHAWLASLRNDNAQGEYYLTDVISMAVADGTPVTGVRASDPAEVAGINTRLQLVEAETALRRRRALALIERGAILADPARIDIRGEVEVGADVFIDSNVLLAGRIRLGDGVQIGPNVVLRDAQIGAGTVVHAHSLLEDCRVGADCELGPYARLRPGSELAARVKIGNFVEIKNTRMAEASKANHLSYIGDADIGRDVNIGAGTITCNYDGANKHRTVIDEGAFIGSGVELVAPVHVGAGATIGAGSTISKEAPAGKLTLSRVRQKTLPDWRRPVKKPKPGQDT